MKKIIFASVLSLTCIAASAQDMYDALRYSQNNYYGTARTISMGNAFTALGGDLGSIGINPAGSAVNSYSQFSLTPNISITSSNTDWFDPNEGSQSLASERNNRTRFTLPSIGFTLNSKTGRKYGVKSWSFGFVANSTATYNEETFAGGRNNTTSMLGGMADWARYNGYSGTGLDAANYYGNYAWESIVAWRSGMISTYNTDNEFIGSTEKEFSDGIGNAGALNQRYGRRTSGNKTDFVVNYAININDRIFLGANLGLVSIDFDKANYFKEGAVNTADFDIDFGGGSLTCFSDSRYRQNLFVDGSGGYGKFGIIAIPVDGLRLGFAVQTPTAVDINERWQYAGECNFTDSKYSGSEQSDEGEFEYKFVSPYRLNAGVAYVLPGGLGTVSADYEMTDYSTMRYRLKHGGVDEAFSAVNQDIRDFTGIAHQLRVGGELKPIPSFALRAGYNLTTSPEYENDGSGKKASDAMAHAVSLGLGYSSPGSFFCDFALRGTFLPSEYIYPISYAPDTFVGSTPLSDLTPEIENIRNIWDIVFTFGWRF